VSTTDDLPRHERDSALLERAERMRAWGMGYSDATEAAERLAELGEWNLAARLCAYFGIKTRERPPATDA
jgi:hypothetical protein